MSENHVDISSLRQNYKSSTLLEEDVQQNPYQQFDQWFKEAVNSNFL